MTKTVSLCFACLIAAALSFAASALTVTLEGYDTIRVASKTADGADASVTLVRKPWGTWNLGVLSVGGEALAGSGTDWEYVYDVYVNYPRFATEFCGGSHGGEEAVAISFADENGAVILPSAKPYETAVLTVMETTRLVPPTRIARSICDVVRVYTFTDGGVTLDVKTVFTRAAFFNLSYIAMLPYNGAVERLVFTDRDGAEVSLDPKSSSPTQEGPVSRTFSGYDAAACRVENVAGSGYDVTLTLTKAEGSIAAAVGSYAAAAVDYGAGGKIYFSRFEQRGRFFARAGTAWETACAWTWEKGKREA